MNYVNNTKVSFVYFRAGDSYYKRFSLGNQ